MAFCTKCGSEVPEGTTFCPKCGMPMGSAAAPAPAPQYAVAPEWDHTAEFDPQDISDNKVFAMACYLLSFFGVLIAIIAAKDSPYAKFHVRESLKISVMEVVCTFMFIIPFLGWFAGGVCILILAIVTLIQFFSVCGGNAKEAPIVRSFMFLK